MIHSISPETSIDTFQSCHLSPVILCFSAIQKSVLNLEEISDDGEEYTIDGVSLRANHPHAAARSIVPMGQKKQKQKEAKVPARASKQSRKSDRASPSTHGNLEIPA